MNFLRKLWSAVNGNKTKIGAVIILIGKGLTYAGVPIGVVIEEVGTAVTGLGLTHAATKVLDTPNG